MKSQSKNLKSQIRHFRLPISARQQRHRRGMVLVLVLIVIAMMSLVGYTFTEMMLAEEEAAIMSARQAQAQCLADSGVEMARLFLAQALAAQQDAGGVYDNPSFRGVLVVDDAVPYNRGRFSLVAPLYQEGNPPGLRFGLEDESAKLNLNMLLEADKVSENGGRKLLMGLPGMTEEIADAILDYIDTDSEPREFGAEIDEYTALDPPYEPKNGPLATVEELLLVRGVTPALLFGTDSNRNFMPDVHEGQTEQLTSDPSENRGWAGYLTLYSMEGNLNAQGQPRIYLNSDDLEKLYDDISAVGDADWAGFIIAYRQFGPSTSNNSSNNNNNTKKSWVDPRLYRRPLDWHPLIALGLARLPSGIAATALAGFQQQGQTSNNKGSTGGGSSQSGSSQGGSSQGGTTSAKQATDVSNNAGKANSAGSANNAGGNSSDPTKIALPVAGRKPDFTKPAKTKINNVLDLVGATVNGTFIGEQQAALIASPFPNDPLLMNTYMPQLMDSFTATGQDRIPARININQAPRSVLMGIPSMTEEIADKIISEREPVPSPERPQRRFETWILSEGIVSLADMKTMMPFICGGGSVYRAQVVGYFDEGGPSARIEAVIDATNGAPKLLFWRNVSHLGRGFPLEALGVAGY